MKWISLVHHRAAIAFILASMLEACIAGTSQSNAGRHISNRELTMEKTGRVVDADTGAGIPGVKVIVNWETLSSGVPGYSGTGGTWCDLQKIVTTDVDGNYTLPDVSKELDLSDRGTRIGKTPFGLASATHDNDYMLTVFKPGYVQARYWNALQAANASPTRKPFDLVAGVPGVHFQSGKVEVMPVPMRKTELAWANLLHYFTWISSQTACSNRMAYSIEAPEWKEMRGIMRDIVRPMACTLPPASTISPSDFNMFRYLSHVDRPSTENTFYERVKELQGLPKSPHGHDPTERITTTAGVLCRALQEEGATK